VPEIYADNYAMTGGGLLLRLFERQVGLFAQGGPAVNLLDDGRQRVSFDGRGGLFFGLESPGCRPEAPGGVRLRLLPCADLYGEGVYVSRFDHNVIGFVRGRAGLGWMVTGPVAWQLVGEARTAGDLDGHHWNNFADAGAGHRWRLLGPIPIDLQLGAHVGSYFGREARDPAPSRKGYADLRLQAATYVEF
jgi:hypothetical protein